MDPVTFGFGVLVGGSIDRIVDVVARKLFWNDEQNAARDAYLEQQSELLREKYHAKMVERLTAKIERLEKRLDVARVNGCIRRAVFLEGEIARAQKVLGRFSEEGPDLLRKPDKPTVLVDQPARAGSAK